MKVSFLAFLTVLVITACGGGDMNSGTPSISVSISPASLSVPTCQTLIFMATVRNYFSSTGET